MCGSDDRTAGLFSYVRLEDRIAVDHLLRGVRGLVKEVLEWFSQRLAELYSHTGRPSILPELMVKRRDKRSNEPHASTSDPDAWLFGKGNGQESRLAYLGHALMENRNGLIETRTTRHQGYAISLAVQKRIEEACG